MTPKEAVEKALDLDLTAFWDHGEWTDEDGVVAYTATLNRGRLTDAFLAALDALGYTVARKQDAADGDRATRRFGCCVDDDLAATGHFLIGALRAYERRHGSFEAQR